MGGDCGGASGNKRNKETLGVLANQREPKELQPITKPRIVKLTIVVRAKVRGQLYFKALRRPRAVRSLTITTSPCQEVIRIQYSVNFSILNSASISIPIRPYIDIEY